MAITRLDLKNRILSSRGLTRARADGLLSDTILNETVRDAQELVVADCDLFPVSERFALVSDKYKIPVPEHFLGVRKVYYIGSSGTILPLSLLTQDEFLSGRDPNDDKASEPVYYCFPYMQQQVIKPFCQSPSRDDFADYSFVTTRSIRTVIDSGINLGRTLSGRRISPGDVVYNLSDGNEGSYGYVECLDTITNKRTGTAGASTSSTRLHDAGVDFTTLGISEDDLIAVIDSDGIVTTYAFVSLDGVSTNYVTYEDVRGVATSFSSGNSYKIGVAQKIRIRSSAPHRGLRGGTNNRFYVADSVSATLTVTTFTDTRVTGTGSLTGVSVGQVAIASGGSHGEISAIGSNYLDVYRWIGGVPTAGETVTVKTCDKYQVQTGPAIERVIMIGPTPNTSDSAGSRSLMVFSNRRPLEPSYDWQELEVPEEYRRALYNAAYWMAAELSGLYTPERLQGFEAIYRRTVQKLKGNRTKDELDAVMSPYMNLTRSRNLGRRYMGTRSGIPYDISSLR